MIAWLFFSFLALGVILMVAGFFLDIPILNLTGTIFLFILGLNLLTDGIEFKTGVVEQYHYGNDFTGEHWVSDSELLPNSTEEGVFLFNKTVVDKLESYDDAESNRFGWFLLTLGSLAFALSMFRL